jgi:ABC-2 type transport system permease protein
MPSETLPRVTALTRHNAVLLLREPGPLIGRLVMPVVLLLVLRPLYQGVQGDAAGTAQAVVGSLVLFSLLAMSVVGGSILTERTWRTWDRLRATPARPGELLLGKAVPVLAVLAAQQAVVLGFGVLALGMPVADPWLLVVACGSWGVALLGMGGAIGVMVSGQGQLSMAYDIGGLLLSTFGGALLPLSELPHWVRAVAPASPGYWAGAALRGAAAGETAHTLRAAGVLLGFACLASAAAAWRIRRGWGRSTTL